MGVIYLGHDTILAMHTTMSNSIWAILFFVALFSGIVSTAHSQGISLADSVHGYIQEAHPVFRSNGGRPLIVSDSAGSFVVLRMREDDSRYWLTRYRDTLVRDWSVPISLPKELANDQEANWGSAMSDVDHNALERPLGLFVKNGSILFFTVSLRGDDSGAVIGHLLDASTGHEVATHVLIRNAVSDEDGDYGDYSINCSPDTSRFVVWYRRKVPNSDESTTEITCRVFDATYQLIGNKRFYLQGGDKGETMWHIYIDNHATLYSVNFGPVGGVTLRTYTLSNKLEVITLQPDTPERGMPSGARLVFEDDTTLSVAIMMSIDRVLSGLTLVRLNLRTTVPIFSTYLPTTPELLDKLTGESEMQPVHFGAFHLTPTESRYVLKIEQVLVVMYTSKPRNGFQGYTKTYVEPGPVLLAVFDSAGNPRWQRGISRDFTIRDISSWHVPLDVRVTHTQMLQVLYSDEDMMYIRKFNLVNGEDVGEVRPLIAIESDYLLSPSILWLNDDRFVIESASGNTQHCGDGSIIQVRLDGK